MKNIVRDLRKNRGLSQSDLGEQLGLSRQAILAIEKERSDPSLPVALRLAQLFEMPVEQIFTLEAAKGRAPREDAMVDVIPAELQDAFSVNGRVAGLFQILSPLHRQQYVRWVTAATSPEARARRVEQVIEWLETTVAHFRD